MHRSADLESLFRATFFSGFATVLEGGAAEPVYLPGNPHRICYTRDYFRSALHEIAHWCVAGAERRLLEDYGYWYAPDGRNAEQQAEFASVEVLPQAYEALFCAACGHDFRVSLDNLNGDGGDEQSFALMVRRRAGALLERQLPERVQRWCEALAGFYQRHHIPLAEGLSETFQLPLAGSR
ncbi:elongation factor P hydroxylase [Alcanivorax sp. DP30]|uniref:elongation factor P hydroxylase n=1 Tax=Alcanivorax sp. DP30 TaxID=2606217 RepID=UPI00136F896B|nr:elongation factor P hydroxylase [Alcanivorax sp. DP30]MZR61519.1 ATPase [Alcanivorax sp. DP30]